MLIQIDRTEAEELVALIETAIVEIEHARDNDHPQNQDHHVARKVRAVALQDKIRAHFDWIVP